jgi:hypothetical protein
MLREYRERCGGSTQRAAPGASLFYQIMWQEAAPLIMTMLYSYMRGDR